MVMQLLHDHGNSDEVLTDDDQPMTTHTTNPVPVIVTKEGVTLRETGRLGDCTNTIRFIKCRSTIRHDW